MLSIAIASTILLAAPAEPALPAWFTLPANARADAGALVYEEYGEAAFKVTDGENLNVQRGRHWKATVVLDGMDESAEDNAVWAAIKPSLTKGGWTVAKEFDVNPFHVTLKLKDKAWAFLWCFSAADIRLDVVELGKQPLKLAIPPPGAKAETVAETADYPWLPRIPGSELRGTTRPEADLVVPISDQEELFLSNAYVHKDYDGPDSLSNLQFVTVYSEGLKAAGWTVIHVGQGLLRDDAIVTARYAKNGRDLWVALRSGGGDYVVDIVDKGAEDLAKKLAAECRLPLYGILFDFNKATLQPASDGELARAKDALLANPKLSVEVQGHTDNVGGDAYNLKLSDDRAKSVMAWLVSHGVPAARLTSKGYGKGNPVESNETAEGRAKNRRVELACKK